MATTPPTLQELQDRFNRHPLIVQARMDGYDLQFCPADGDIWIAFPQGTTPPDGLEEDDLFEHPDTRGKGCAKAEEPYQPITEALKDAAALKKLLVTLDAEQEIRQKQQTKGEATESS
jgi:hypothetical protein